MRCFRTRGKKGEEHFDPADPPRCRANKQRGRGTYANDRPPVLGTVGRETGQVRLRVVQDTKGTTLRAHAHQFTRGAAIINTDEYQSYNGIARQRDSVCHGRHEWARDDDGDGFCEVHCNTTEGLWTDVRNFLRPFKGVHKKNLAGYIALCEFRRNLKRVSPAFIADLVAFHSFYP
ncbi:transposase [Anaerolineae bacterium CFX8]|nr:transposase [Anaerolineae bacterium CFX8]